GVRGGPADEDGVTAGRRPGQLLGPAARAARRIRGEPAVAGLAPPDDQPAGGRAVEERVGPAVAPHDPDVHHASFRCGLRMSVEWWSSTPPLPLTRITSLRAACRAPPSP